MVTDKQYQELSKKCEELERKYAQMSRDIASIKMALDIKKTRKAESQPKADCLVQRESKHTFC